MYSASVTILDELLYFKNIVLLFKIFKIKTEIFFHSLLLFKNLNTLLKYRRIIESFFPHKDWIWSKCFVFLCRQRNPCEWCWKTLCLRLTVAALERWRTPSTYLLSNDSHDWSFRSKNSFFVFHDFKDQLVCSFWKIFSLIIWTNYFFYFFFYCLWYLQYFLILILHILFWNYFT